MHDGGTLPLIPTMEEVFAPKPILHLSTNCLAVMHTRCWVVGPTTSNSIREWNAMSNSIPFIWNQTGTLLIHCLQCTRGSKSELWFWYK